MITSFKITNSQIRYFFILIFISILIPISIAFGRIPYYLSENDVLELLKGERQVSLSYENTKDIDDELKNQIKQDMSKRLNLVGIETPTWEVGISFIHVTLGIVKDKNGQHSGNIQISFNKKAEFFKKLDAFLEKGNVIHTYSIVWYEDIVFMNANSDKIMQICQDLIGKFLNDYLKANPGNLNIETPSNENLFDLYEDPKYR
jgi:hypothetical protein